MNKKKAEPLLTNSRNSDIDTSRRDFMIEPITIRKLAIRGMIFFLLVASIGFCASAFLYDNKSELEKDLVHLQADIAQSEQVISVETSRLEVAKMRYKAKRCDLAGLKIQDGQQITEETRALCF